MAHLTYFIKDAYLVGDIGLKHFQFKAVSGGYAGSIPDRTVGHVANNPYLVGQVENDAKDISGGPLPCGAYLLRPNLNRRSRTDPKKTIKWIDLVPAQSTQMGRRTGGFAIHGHGTEGSNGCIVPSNANDLNDLLYAVLHHLKSRTGEVSLNVVAGELDDQTA